MKGPEGERETATPILEASSKSGYLHDVRTSIRASERGEDYDSLKISSDRLRICVSACIESVTYMHLSAIKEYLPY